MNNNLEGKNNKTNINGYDIVHKEVDIDGDGIEDEVIIKPVNSNPIKMPGSCRIAEEMRCSKPKTKVRKITNERGNVLGGDYGPGSRGFAGIFMIASIVSVIGVIIAYIIFKY